MVFGLLNAPTALLALDRAAETFATLLCVRADPATVFSTLPLALLASIRAAVEVPALFVAMVSSPPGPPRLVATIERSAPRGRLSIAGRLGEASTDATSPAHPPQRSERLTGAP